MAVLNFAHLKNRKAKPAAVTTPQTTTQKTEQKTRHGPPAGGSGGVGGGVMSFAHLKNRKTAQEPTAHTPKPVSDEKQVMRLQRLQGIGIMPSARLAAVNYCNGCPRFWAADENEKKAGVEYGRCQRSLDDGVETWRIIPLSARVYRCAYHLPVAPGANKAAPHGPAGPCKIKNWKITH